MAYGQPSGTTAFNPLVSDICIDAFERLGISLAGNAEGLPASVTDLMKSAQRSCNFVNARFSVRGVNLWKVDETPTIFDLTAGQTTITLGSDVVAQLTTYRRVTINGTATDVLMYPLSRDDYSAIPDKTMAGLPTSYWFNRQVSPVCLIWPTPDDNGPYQLATYLMHQIQDANPTVGETTDLPWRAFYAYTAAVAYDLALKWAPARAVLLKQEAMEAWQEFSDDDIEHVSFFIDPDYSSYFV